MNAKTTSRIARLNAKLHYYETTYGEAHPNKEAILNQIAAYEAAPDSSTEQSDATFSRIEVLVGAVRKAKALLATAPPEAKAALETRITEYQQSLKNIQEFGRETLPRKPAGVVITVPADVMDVGVK
jgi:hypothetical protein